jgi:short-subunit dehydrogenase
MDLQGKRIILTGAASGIGRALLSDLCAFEAQIVAVDRNVEALQTAVAALPAHARVQPFAADLSDPAAIDALFAFADDALGAVDVFIANAGFAYYEPFDGTWAHVEAIYRVNVFTPLAALDRLIARANGQPVTFVITASAMARLGLAGYAVYASTKAALDRFADAFRLEAPPHIHLMLVYPIATRSNFFQHGRRAAPVPFPSQTPETVAAAIVRGLQRDRRSVHPSRLFRLAALVDRVLPILWLYQRFNRRAFRQWLKQP